MSSRRPLLVCVVGPTAIGKTAMAIAIAKSFQTEIVSADSRQFFKEMTIGTAVPSTEELAAVPHHFIQNKSVFDTYSVGDFETEALAVLDTLFKTHELVVMAGGSGLYVNAVVNGLDNFPKIPEDIRISLNEELEQHGLEPLLTELEEADPSYYEAVDKQNPHRIIRALEVVRSTGRPFSSFLKNRSKPRPFDTLFIGLTADRDIVYERINKRVDIMMQEGLLDEARALYPHRELNALQTVGYRELFEHFDGTLTLDEAVSEIKKNTRRFAKRQGTWFRRYDTINWFSYLANPGMVISYIKEKSAH